MSLFFNFLLLSVNYDYMGAGDFYLLKSNVDSSYQVQARFAPCSADGAAPTCMTALALQFGVDQLVCKYQKCTHAYERTRTHLARTRTQIHSSCHCALHAHTLTHIRTHSRIRTYILTHAHVLKCKGALHLTQLVCVLTTHTQALIHSPMYTQASPMHAFILNSHSPQAHSGTNRSSLTHFTRVTINSLIEEN